MKFKKFFVCCITLILILSTVLPASATFGRTYTAPKGTPTLDGKVDKVWKTARWTNVDKPYDGSVSTNSEVRVKLLWDDEYLYFLAEMYDEDVFAKNDLFEVYLNQSNSVSYSSGVTHTRFNLTGGIVADGHGGKYTQFDAPHVTAKLSNNFYRMEGALKWPDGKPSVGNSMGIEFMYDDGKNNAPTAEAFRWNADTANGDLPPYQVPKAFGTLKLAAAGSALSDNTYVSGETATKNLKNAGSAQIVSSEKHNIKDTSTGSTGDTTSSKPTTSSAPEKAETTSQKAETTSQKEETNDKPVTNSNPTTSTISDVASTEEVVSADNTTSTNEKAETIIVEEYVDDEEPETKEESSNTVALIISIASAVIILGAVAVVVFVVLKGKKAK